MKDNETNRIPSSTTNRPIQPPMRGPMRGGIRMVEKPKNFKKAMARLSTFSSKYIALLVLATVLAIVSVTMIILGPQKLQRVTDLISYKDETTIMDLEQIFSLCLTLVILYSISMVTHVVQEQIFANISQKITKRLRSEINIKINKLPLSYFDTTTFGDILSRVTNDVDAIGQTLQNSFPVFVRQIVFFAGSLTMMFITNYIMAFSAVGSVVVGVLFMLLIIKVSQKYFKQQQNSLGEINGHIEEIYAGHNVVKAYNGQRKASQKFAKINDELFVSAWKSQFLSGLMQPLMGFVSNFGFVVVCVVGGALTISGLTEIGVIVAFMLYIRYFTNPLSQIAQATTSLQSMAAASERVFEFLDAKEMEADDVKTVLTNVKGDVRFKNVKFGYSPEKIIIKGFNADIKAGQKVAIVGPTGAGKTTIVNLLMRFYELNEGEILVDGVPLTDLSRANVHDLFGMVLQDTWIFEGTIIENVRYGKNNVSDLDVINALKAVGLHHFIMTLPDNYNTVLDDKAGQKQLITIARAMIENAPMLILDEATSNVDTRTEIITQQAMDRLMKGRTSFIIAHRLSTIKNADLILVLKDGDIVEKGTHKQLLKEDGFYAELYNSQFTI